jgi:omega-6 fatty acid desaturase (delta-12 desaturase)
MRTGPELILATKRYANDDTTRSWWHVISTALLLGLGFAGTFWDVHPLSQIFFSVVTGLLLVRMFVIYHDQQHHAILSQSRLAEGLMRVFGVLALSASSIWRSSHNHHHNHNSKLRGADIGSFPIMTRAQFEKSPSKEQFMYLFQRHPLTVLFGYVTVFLVGMCTIPFLNHPKKHWDCLLALVVHIAIGAALVIFWGWGQLLLTQTIPCFIMYALGSYLFYAQHTFPGVTFNDKAGWTYEKAALESSSFLNTNPVMAWFTANIGYHHIHHLNSKIPFYRLPEVMREMPELHDAVQTSLHPRDIWSCMRLKLWDVEAQRMISMREFSRNEAVTSRGVAEGAA